MKGALGISGSQKHDWHAFYLQDSSKTSIDAKMVQVRSSSISWRIDSSEQRSHSAVYESTAEETLNKIGGSYGPGVYFDYLFLIVWAIDVFWIWRGTQKISQSQQVLFYVGRSYLLFIAFNGVVIFKSGCHLCESLCLQRHFLSKRASESHFQDASTRQGSPSKTALVIPKRKTVRLGG
jgi:hypothetical protein